MPANVLIVEDEWLIAEDHADTLRDANFAVVGPCPSVKTAMAAIETQHIDAALLDIELRGEKSYAVAEALQERKIPFAFLSGHGQQDLPAGLRDQKVLSKPVERAALLAAIGRMSRSG